MPFQKTFTLGSKRKGCHLITQEVVSAIQDGLRDTQIGILHLFMMVENGLMLLHIVNTHLQQSRSMRIVTQTFEPVGGAHGSEELIQMINPDMDMALDRIVPEDLEWQHTNEGPDDSVSHTKTSLIGASLSIPITQGRLALGTWQGIYLTEFRHMAHRRTLVATIL